jgi:hypothetical protein
MRGGTFDRMHVSEFGKICAKYPDKAEEVITGSLPALTPDGIAIIESTAEGQEGSFYDMTMRAQALAQQRAKLSKQGLALHFYPWFDAEEYRLDPGPIAISDEDHLYFDKVEPSAASSCSWTSGHGTWRRATATSRASEERMWQEYPSTPEEAFRSAPPRGLLRPGHGEAAQARRHPAPAPARRAGLHVLGHWQHGRHGHLADAALACR